jgi:membrane-associated phospholipid phosphatase
VVTLGLREGRFHDLNLFAPVGIISMPSFHATGAVLTAIALWPVRHLRWPVAIYESVMVAATVPMGAHYLVDVVAGVALAFMAASVTRMPAMGLIPRG